MIFLTGHADAASCVQPMKAGAVDFLEKPIEPKALLAAILSALTREKSIRTAQSERRSLCERLNMLSAREHQIFDRLVAGKVNKEIAYELGISERTVKTDRSDLMAKLGTVSIADLGRQVEQLRRALGRERRFREGVCVTTILSRAAIVMPYRVIAFLFASICLLTSLTANG